MKLFVIGAGAIGGTLGARMFRDGHDVTLVDADAAHVAAIQRDGLRMEGPVEEFTARARESMAAHVTAMVGYLHAGAVVFDYGNSLRSEAQLGGCERAFDYPGFIPAYLRPLFCQGKGPFRWVALSGDPADIARTEAALETLTNDIERQVAKLHESWEGLAAVAQREAQEEWEQGLMIMRQALAELRAAAEQASRNYAEAADANRSMWESLG